MACPRCGADTPSWCADCERGYDAWSRQHAADILWQTGSGAVLAILVGLGAPLVGLSPVVSIFGVVVGASSALGLRTWSNARRRRQYLATSVPRAQLTSG